MRKPEDMTHAERVIYRISELRDLGLRLARAGRAAGLHNRPPRGVVREDRPGPYGTSPSPPEKK